MLRCWAFHLPALGYSDAHHLDNLYDLSYFLLPFVSILCVLGPELPPVTQRGFIGVFIQLIQKGQ